MLVSFFLGVTPTKMVGVGKVFLNFHQVGPLRRVYGC